MSLFALVVFQSFLSCNALIALPSGCKLHRVSRVNSNTHHGRNIYTATSLNAHPRDSPSDTADPPNLRSLYDPLPRIDCNGTVTNNSNSTQTKWVNKVTSGKLPTESGSPHELHFEIHHRLPASDATKRQRKGLVGLVLHGGPGAACFPKHTQFFSPDLYEYVVLADQRGCGKSTPLGEVKSNRLELLVHDIEILRRHIIEEGLIDKWVEKDDEHLIQSTQQRNSNKHPWDVILGGSWGCTLALAYAHTYPQNVRAMVLRGVCLFRQKEIDWLFGDPPESSANIAKSSVGKTSNLRDLVAGGGSSNASMALPTTSTSVKEVESQTVAAQIFPEQWKEFSSGVGRVQNNKRSVLQSYYHRLLGTDVNNRFNATKSWFRWEMGIYSNRFEKTDQNKEKNLLLVWDPVEKSWVFEDATLPNQKCRDQDRDRKQILHSLRRFSSTLSSCASSNSDQKILEPLPLPIEETISTATTEIKETVKGNPFDPATYIPAQAMLTCFYSVNDEYCIQPYNSFLSLNPPTSNPFSSWYSSKLPPSSTDTQSHDTTMPSDFPLPPTIAIQGGNDAICPPDTALDLVSVWKQLELRIALTSGHSMYDPVIAGEIVKSLERFGTSLMVDDDDFN